MARRSSAAMTADLAAQQRHQEALVELARLALLNGRLDDMLEAAAQLVVAALRVDFCAVFDLTPDGETFVLRSGYNPDPAARALIGRLVVPTAVDSMIGYAARVGKVVVSDDLAKEHRFRVLDSTLRWGTRSAAAMPIPGTARPYGAFQLLHRTPRHFSAADVRFLDSAMSLLAAAIDRMRAIAALAASERRYRTIVETARDGIWTIDAAGTTTFVNERLATLLGYAAEDLVGRPATAVLEAPHQGQVVVMLNGQRQDEAAAAEVRFCRGDGSILWALVSATPLIDDTGAGAGMLALVTDLTAQRDAEHYKHRALHDPLTGLPNRALFEYRLDEALAAAQRDSEPCAVLALDLDGFKPINDVYGHQAGDMVLREVGRRLQGEARADDTVGRVGGDEFNLLLRGADGACAGLIARRVLDAIAQPLRAGGLDLRVRASVGVALAPVHGIRRTTILRRADAAMYRAKREGAGWAVAGVPSARPRGQLSA